MGDTLWEDLYRNHSPRRILIIVSWGGIRGRNRARTARLAVLETETPIG